MGKLLRSPAFNLAASAGATAAVTGLAYHWLGFLGIAIVGLLMAFVAVWAELDQETTKGFLVRDERSRAERAADRADVEAMAVILLRAKILGFALTIVGGVGFFVLQLPR